jgi:hypothetical protein
MYDYVFVFVYTMLLTAFITKWCYSARKAPIIQEEHPVLQVTELKKDPANIPTVSREKHDEFVQLMSQWKNQTKTKRFPEREYIYSESFLPSDRVPCYRMKSVDEWREFEKKHENAPIGTWIHFDDPAVLSPSHVCVTFAIVRIDAPERWEEHVYFYRKGDPIPKA